MCGEVVHALFCVSTIGTTERLHIGGFCICVRDFSLTRGSDAREDPALAVLDGALAAIELFEDLHAARPLPRLGRVARKVFLPASLEQPAVVHAVDL